MLIMKKSVFNILCTLCTIGALCSCEEEKPMIIIPPIVNPSVPFVYFEAYTNDTLFINEGQTAEIAFRTIPWDMIDESTDATIGFIDSTGAKYNHLQLSTPTLMADSAWLIKLTPQPGSKSGDELRLVVSEGERDTTFYSDPMVLWLVPAPVEYLHFECFTADTLSIDEGQTDSLQFRTIPADLPIRESTKIWFADSTGAEYEYIDFTPPAMLVALDTITGRKDTTWTITVNLLYGSQSTDVIRMALYEEKQDTTFYSAPMVIEIVKAEQPVSYALVRVSDQISAWENGGQATVRFRTEPWNLLLDSEKGYTMQVTDTLGKSTSLFTVGTPQFMPDSTWTLKLAPQDSGNKDAYGAITVSGPDTTMTSAPFNLKRVSFSLNEIRVLNGPTVSLSKDKVASYVLPAVTNFTGQRIRFIHNGDNLTVGDSLLDKRTSRYNILDLNEPLVVTLWKYDLRKDYTIMATNTRLPVVRITTPRSAKITSKEVWMEDCMMKIELADGTVSYYDTLSVRGRGNGTWTETDKKPYSLRLNQKSKILGMRKQRRWVLLANYKDYTLLRNDAAFWLSKQTSMPYTVNGQHVELVLNGEYRGNYYLCEQIRIDNSRVDIDDPNLDNPSEGGFLLEIDSYLGYNDYGHEKDLGFWSKTYRLPYIFKDPDEDLINSSHAAYKYVQNYVNEMEGVLNDYIKVRKHEYEKYIDVQSAIDFALIQELTMNHDSYNTWPKEGPHSTYLYMDKTHTGGKLHFGPVWDFDYHTFMPQCYEGGHDLAKSWMILKLSAKTSSGRYYYSDMLQDPRFKTALVERWDELKYKFKELPDYIDMMADSISASEACNRELWFNVTSNTQNGDRMEFRSAIRRMKDGFLKRWEWIDVNIRKL